MNEKTVRPEWGATMFSTPHVVAP